MFTPVYCAPSKEKQVLSLLSAADEIFMRPMHHQGDIPHGHLEVLILLKIFLCMAVLSVCMSVYHLQTVPIVARRECQTPWNCSYRWYQGPIWMLEIEPFPLKKQQMF